MRDLNEFDDEFDNVEVPESKFDEVPDGRYETEIVKLTIGETKAGDPSLRWQFKILEGEHAGRFVFKTSVIKAGKALEWLKKDLKMIGFEGTRPSELADMIDAWIGIKLSVHKKTYDDSTWVYLGKRKDRPKLPGRF